MISICFFITSCATNLERGQAHYQKQEYDQAAYYWSPLAKQGDPYAQYNVGLLWEYGLGSTSQNSAQAAEWYFLSAKQGFPMAMVKVAEYQLSLGSKETALTWLYLAARWGNENAVTKLKALQEVVPRADLLEQQIAENQRKEKESADTVAGLIAIGAVFGAAAAGYGADGGQSSIGSPNAFNPANDTDDDSCSSDYSCGIGYSCVKKSFSVSGVCMKSVDSYGAPTYKIPSSDSLGIKTEGSCTLTAGCPIGFRCDRDLQECVR